MMHDGCPLSWVRKRPPWTRSATGSYRADESGSKIFFGRRNRRLEIFRQLGRAKIPAHIVRADDAELREVELDENVERLATAGDEIVIDSILEAFQGPFVDERVFPPARIL